MDATRLSVKSSEVSQEELLKAFPEELVKAFPECCRFVEQHIKRHLKNAGLKAKRYHRWFRDSGILIVLLGVSLPLIAGLNYSNKNQVLSFVSVLIAALTGLRSFYQWDREWQVLRFEELMVRFLVTQWELSLLKLAHQPHDNTSKAFARTEQLLNDVQNVVETQLVSYF
jgi:hypothetical protein